MVSYEDVITLKEDKFKINEIRMTFEKKNFITYDQLFEFYKYYEPDLKIGTFKWRIYKLKEKKVINSFKKGMYVLEKRKEFIPHISVSTKKIYNHVKRNFPYIDICIWETSWVHEFMNHQPFTSLVILEVDRDVVDVVFQSLRERRNFIYHNPKGEDIQNYILNENAIIVKPIIKSSPTVKNEKVNISKIEKMLVDIFFDDELFLAYHGQELKNIFERAYEDYALNMTTIYRYARNRGIKDKIIDFITYGTEIDKKYI